VHAVRPDAQCRRTRRVALDVVVRELVFGIRAVEDDDVQVRVLLDLAHQLGELPGCGFSGEPITVGWGPGGVANAWAKPMRRLGYTRYVAQGGDVGAAVTDVMAIQAPEGLAGIHLSGRR
jgi:hypothetical protein